MTYNADQFDPQIVFEQRTGVEQEISGINLHFLAGNDCYSGWSGMYSASHDAGFLVQPRMQFGLDPKFVYQAMLQSNLDQPVSGIRSMLVRFIRAEKNNPSDRFARFLGTCQDQSINCCVPIKCSDQTTTCIAVQAFATQEISWTM